MTLEDKTIDAIKFTKYELDCLNTALSYRYLGQHWEYKIYGHRFDRTAYKRSVDRHGIKYAEHSRYKGAEYIKPLSFD